MKTVLVPTDFNLESVQIIDALIQDQPHETFNIIFIHAFKISDSITDMLMLNRRSRDYENVSDEFYQSLNDYKSKYQDQLSRVGIEYFYGSTVAAFKNFIEHFEVEYIGYPKNYNFKPINKFSIDPKYLTERSGCKLLVLDTTNIRRKENLIDTRIEEKQLQDANA
ncbi:hypothetical protein [Pedobacter rhizosphaerae]|uniref:Universal stress protein family protein n=1 Tax=Pedobacter rhizosphaerae TaxID=390241 RepID=A0A1H9Q662_9SPHI|nr:hypothetical protein [Pedobacter rhizosphaerae]SER55924.1 hypothetical protein SAMN04488023_11148 [Pedobacter rhizosphaerae]